MVRASNLITCSFCGRSHDHPEVRKLISGPAVYICDACINICNGILDRELGRDAHGRLADIGRTVSHYVIGRYRACVEWFRERGLEKATFFRSAPTQHEEERPPSTVSFTFRENKRYQVEISLGLYQCLVSNTTIIKQLEAFGFHYVNALGVGRNRTIEATWLHDDTPVTIRRIEGKIDMDLGKSEYPLAELLLAICHAEELQPPKENP